MPRREGQNRKFPEQQQGHLPQITADAGNTVTSGCSGDAMSNLHHYARKLVAEDHRRIIRECVVKHVQIGSTDTAESNLNLDLAFTATWVRHISDRNIPFARRIF
jgi:hypothetical protein